MTPIYISVGQAAERSGVPTRTIRWAITNNYLPATRLGDRVWMITPADLTAWLQVRKEKKAKTAERKRQ
jgi:excisionase family DNA binding protein